MTDLPLNKPAGILVKTTCVDYPGIVAGSFFLKGCIFAVPTAIILDLYFLPEMKN